MKRFYAVILAILASATFVYANGPIRANGLASTTPAPANVPAAGTTTSASAPTAREWQKEDDRILGHIRANKLAAMKNTAAGIMGLFHDSILTKDVNPVWHGEYFSAVNGGPQVHFGVRCLFNNEDNTATDNDLTVFANDISPLLGTLTVNGNGYTTVKAFTTVRGNQYFEFDMENSLHVKAWLITADSAALPYTPVTRREYLDEARKEVEGLKEAAIADVHSKVHVRSAAEQDAEKQQMLDQLKANYSGAELEGRTRVYLHSFISDEDYLKEAIAHDAGGYIRTLVIIDSLLLNSTPQQLSQPAVVSVAAAQFQGFEDGAANTTTLVRLNPAYFTSGDEQAPKCLLICWRYNPADHLSAGIDNQLSQNFSVGSFKALLSK